MSVPQILPAQGKRIYPSYESFVARGTSPLNFFYTGAVNQSDYFTFAFAVGTLYAYPVVLPTGVIDKIGFEVTTVSGAGGVARAGIYKTSAGSIIYPGALLVDGGEFAVDGASGAKVASSLSIQVHAGLYWFVYLCGTSAPEVRYVNNTGINPILGIQPTMGATPYDTLTKLLSYQALPATFPAGGLPDTPTGHPAVGVHFAS